MASGKGIEAGKAYVRAYVDDNPLTRGLRRAEIAMRRTLRSMGTAGKIADRGWKGVSKTVRGISRDITAADRKFQRLGSRAAKAAAGGARAVGKGFGAAGRGVGSALSGAGGAVAGAGAGLLGAGAGIGALLGKAVGAAGSKQATLGKFSQVFGDSAEQAGKWADTLAAEIGRGETEVKGFLAGTQDLLVPIGFEPGAAEQMSKDVTKLAYDLASFNDVADADAMNDLQAALTGSGEVMKKYGVVLTETTTNQELMNAGINPKNATEAQKTWARFQQILKGTTAAQGDAARTSGEWSNVVKRVQASLTGVMETVGEALIPVLTPLALRIGEIVKGGAEWLKANPQIARTVAMVALALFAGGAAFVAFGTAAVFAGAVVTGTMTVLGALGAAFAFLLSPVGLVVVALTAVAGVAAYALYQSGILGDTLAWLSEKFAPLADMATRAFAAIKNALAQNDFARAAAVLWAALKLAFASGIEWIKSAWIGLRLFLSNVWNALAGSVESVWTQLSAGIVRTLATAIGKIAGMLAKAASKLGFSGLSAGLGAVSAAAAGVSMANSPEQTQKRLNELAEQRRKAEDELADDAERERKSLAEATAQAREDFEAAVKSAAEAKQEVEQTPPQAGGEQKPGAGGPPPGEVARAKADDAINKAAVVGTEEGMQALFKALQGGGEGDMVEQQKLTRKDLGRLIALQREAQRKAVVIAKGKT